MSGQKNNFDQDKVGQLTQTGLAEALRKDDTGEYKVRLINDLSELKAKFSDPKLMMLDPTVSLYRDSIELGIDIVNKVWNAIHCKS